MVDCRLNQGWSLDSSHWGFHSHNLTNLPRLIGFFLSRLRRRSLPTSSLLPWWECEPSALSGWDLHQSHWAVGVLPVPCWLLLCREDWQLHQVSLSTWILLPWWYPKTFRGCVSSWIYWKTYMLQILQILKSDCVMHLGTRHATQFPCPRGYYNPEPMTQSLDSCLPCPPGHYCEKERLTKVSGKCKAGR